MKTRREICIALAHQMFDGELSAKELIVKSKELVQKQLTLNVGDLKYVKRKKNKG